MRFLADEGVDGMIVGSIRGDGHDVRWMAEEREGAVLVRVDGISNEKKGRIVARAMREHESDLPGAFTVIQHGTIRIRRA
jgi:hypothetical protein